ncbi:MAG: metalloregulator ArsR/SmtB family transcription factor [Chloroflexi bacterium]|nr:metalloregulator ArsR/SmtB family transcription factor [Chloroflexota bacterium]
MTTLRWNSGTAYDFFISLLALHHAADFGLRPNWTAGVRQRLSVPQREFLERVFSFASVPLDWISSLPEPKDALPVLGRAADLAPADRLRILTLPMDTSLEAHETLDHIAERGLVTAKEKEFLGRTLTRRNEHLKAAELDQLLKVWMNLDKSSEQILTALQEYYNAFFADEETRIRPVLQAGLEHALELSGRVPLPVLVEELSRGVRFEDVESTQELILVPSYWSTPFVFTTNAAEGSMQIVFGCRPDVQSIAPGAETPDLLINALKSLADPTRLRILRYLTGQPLTPTELSRLLRLRPPTVLHHLQALRLAELVAIRVSENGEKCYAARLETLNVIFTSVKDFLKKQD